jgi:hypothetical protein
VRQAREALQGVRHTHGTTVVIETVETLAGERIDDEARRLARSHPHPLPPGALYILVDGLDQDAAVFVNPGAARGREVSPADRAAIRGAFVEPLRAGEPDQGLEKGIQAITSTLDHLATTRPRSGLGGALVSAAVLLGLGVLLLIDRFRARYRAEARRRRKVASAMARALGGQAVAWTGGEPAPRPERLRGRPTPVPRIFPIPRRIPSPRPIFRGTPRRPNDPQTIPGPGRLQTSRPGR